MAPQQKGKQRTKGQKEILQGNTETLAFYRNVIFGANTVYILIRVIWFLDSFKLLNWFATILSLCIYCLSYNFMRSMAKPHYSESGGLIDGGIDLNMESGMAEHSKDVIILTAIVQSLCIISDYFWFLLLLAPIRAMYMLWKYILAPWIFEEAPSQEMDAKAQKKMDRKMKRAGMMQ